MVPEDSITPRRRVEPLDQLVELAAAGERLGVAHDVETAGGAVEGFWRKGEIVLFIFSSRVAQGRRT